MSQKLSKKMTIIVFLSRRLGSGRLSSSIDDLIKWDQFLSQRCYFFGTSKVFEHLANSPTKFFDYGYGWHITNDSIKGKCITQEVGQKLNLY
jgi:hypothetical protein